MRKLKVALLSALFATLFISNITLSSADDLGINSDFIIGNNSGYVLASSNTEMYFYAENDTDPIAGASIEIQVTGSSELGQFLDDITYHPAGANVTFGSTNSAGEFTFIWETPTVSGTETVTFEAIAHHETEEFYLGEQVIVITNDAVENVHHSLWPEPITKKNCQHLSLRLYVILSYDVVHHTKTY